MDESVTNQPQNLQTPPLPTESLTNPKKKLYLIGAVLAVVFMIIAGLVFYIQGTKQELVSIDQPKTWQIIINYNATSDQFKLKELQLLDKEINPDERGAKFSDYELKLLDENKNVLISKKVTVMTFIPDVGMEVNPPEGSETSQPSEFESIMYLNHEVNGKHIILTRRGESVLEMTVPSKKKALIDFPNISKAHAASCNPLEVAFISEGYTDFNKFHQNAQTFADAFINLPPFNSKNPSIFDFKVVDNSQSLGCVNNGILYCIRYQSAKADQIVRAQYPKVSKIVILVNAGLNNPKDQGALGVTSGIGGDYAVFATNFGNVSPMVLTVAKHELLGHGVGQLYDRYVAVDPSYGKFNNSVRSNCTEKPGGESFWPTAGISGTFNGCGNKAYIAPSASSYCPKPPNPNLLASGTPASLMSAAGCGGPNFDSVEQYWITNQILPDYTGCEGGATPIPNNPGGTNQPTATPTIGLPASTSIVGNVFNDANNNDKKDSGEAGVSGATLALTGVISKNTSSQNDGRYSFTDLAIGDYVVTLTYQGQSVASNNIPLSQQLSSPPEVNFAIRTSQGNNPVIVPVTPTPTVKIVIPTPTIGSGGNNGFRVNGTPTPTPDQYYSCNPDPNCQKSGKNIQLCPLVCTPQG